MKKYILILLLFTGFLQAQTLPNPTFGNTTTNTLKVKTNTEASTSTKLSTQETDGSINFIQPINVPIPYAPANYSVSNQSIGQHLTGIDTRLGQISSTTAGITQRVYFTADNTTVTAGTFFTSSLTGKGSTATGSPPALVLADNTKGYFTKDVISVAFPAATIGYAGSYTGQLTVSATPTPVATQQRFTVEIYRTNNGGTPIASGVSGAPTGDLGVTVVAILDSGILNLTAGSITNIPVTGILTQNITLNTGERLRYHVSAAKIGAGGGNVTFGVYYGSSYNSYYDVPVAITTDAVLNKSSVTGVTATDALNTLNTLKANDSNVVHKTGDEIIQGIKSINNSSQPYTSSFIFNNSFNGGILANNNAPFRLINSLNGIGGHVLNEGIGVGLFFNNISSGTLAYFDRESSSTGDFISWQISKVNAGKIDYLGNIFTSGSINSQNKITWGNGAFASGISQIYNEAVNGTVLVPKTGSTNDLLITNGMGQGAIAISASTQNVIFSANAKINGLIGAGTRTVITDANGNLSATDMPPSRPYKVYTALLTQSGTSAPTATVLENTLGGTVVWTRSGVGSYVATLTGAFVLNKTSFSATVNGTPIPPSTSSVNIYGNRATVDTIAVSTVTNTGFADGTISPAYIEIRVYN